MACTTYVNDIFEYLRESEVRCAGQLRHFIFFAASPASHVDPGYIGATSSR